MFKASSPINLITLICKMRSVEWYVLIGTLWRWQLNPSMFDLPCEIHILPGKRLLRPESRGRQFPLWDLTINAKNTEKCRLSTVHSTEMILYIWTETGPHCLTTIACYLLFPFLFRICFSTWEIQSQESFCHSRQPWAGKSNLLTNQIDNRAYDYCFAFGYAACSGYLCTKGNPCRRYK